MKLPILVLAFALLATSVACGQTVTVSNDAGDWVQIKSCDDTREVAPGETIELQPGWPCVVQVGGSNVPRCLLFPASAFVEGETVYVSDARVGLSPNECVQKARYGTHYHRN